MVEEPDSLSQQDRHQLDVQFVDEASVQALLGDVRAGHTNGLVARDRLGLRDRPFNAIGDEGEGGVVTRPAISRIKTTRVTNAIGTYGMCEVWTNMPLMIL